MADVAAQSTRPRPRLRSCDEPHWVHAKFPGQSAGCGHPFSKGALIQYDRATDRWRAECCAPEEVDAA